MKLHYGGTRPGTSLNIHLQPMRCSGKSTFYPSELASAERNLLKSNVIKIRDELNKKIDFIAVSLNLSWYRIDSFGFRKTLMQQQRILLIAKNIWREENPEMDLTP